MVSEFQASEEMVATKKSIHDVGFDACVQVFTYTVATEHLDWDLAFLDAELNAQVVAWCDQWRVSIPLSDETPISRSVEVPVSLSGKV